MTDHVKSTSDLFVVPNRLVSLIVKQELCIIINKKSFIVFLLMARLNMYSSVYGDL